jgi:hypothetical protein
MNVTISTATRGAQIRFTLDGTTPDEHSRGTLINGSSGQTGSLGQKASFEFFWKRRIHNPVGRAVGIAFHPSGDDSFQLVVANVLISDCLRPFKRNNQCFFRRSFLRTSETTTPWIFNSRPGIRFGQRGFPALGRADDDRLRRRYNVCSSNVAMYHK